MKRFITSLFGGIILELLDGVQNGGVLRGKDLVLPPG